MHDTTLVFLPGLANDGEVFDDLRARLRPAGTTAGALLAGARVSDVQTRHASLPEMAAALLREEPGRLVLVGHSMGGMLAQHAMRQAPERIAGLALLATTARPDTPELIRLRTEACELFAAGQMMDLLQANVAFAFHPDHSANEALVQRYLAMVQRAGAAQLIAQNRALMARDDSRPHLGAIDTRRCPTIVLCGEDDLLTTPQVARELAQAVRGARCELLPRCGHMLTLEQPDAVAAALAGWLAEVVQAL